MDTLLFILFIVFVIWANTKKHRKMSKKSSGKTPSDKQISKYNREHETWAKPARKWPSQSKAKPYEADWETYDTSSDASTTGKYMPIKKTFKKPNILLRGGRHARDQNRSRRDDWGARQRGDIVSGSSLLVFLGVIFIVIFVLSRT